MKLLNLLACLLFTFICECQSVLPGFKDGYWILLDTNGIVISKTDYQYINLFDLSNSTYYQKKGFYGILSTTGKEITPPIYSDIISYGKGLYGVQKDNEWQFIKIFNDLVSTLPLDVNTPPIVLSENWLLINQENSNFILNIPTGSSIPFKDSSYTFKVYFNYLSITKDTVSKLYSPVNEFISDSIFTIFTDENSTVFTSAKKSYWIDQYGFWEAPFKITDFYSTDKVAFISNSNKGILFDVKTRFPIFEGPYWLITNYDEKYWCVYSGTMSNLASKKTGQLLFPKSTSFFYKNEVGYVLGRNDNLSTLVSQDGQPLIKGYYSSISVRNKLVQLYLTGSYGLYSLKKKKEILPCIYNSITNSNGRFKALTSNTYTVFEMDTNHTITQRIDGTNQVSIRTNTNNAKSESFYIDTRLFDQGWFIDSNSIVVKKNIPTKNYIWGLLNENDSIIKKPMYHKLKYLYGPFTLIPKPNINIEYFKKTIQVGTLSIIDHTNGKIVGPNNAISVDTLDFLTRDFMRYSTLSNFGIIQSDGKFKSMKYIQQDNQPILRYCIEGRTEIIEEEKYELFTENPSIFLSSSASRINSNTGLYGYYDVKIKYIDSKWNYLLPDGSDCFSEPFDFAFNFIGSRAIAVRKGKWGVVSKDSIVIPFIYSHIERKIIGTDTLFITQLIPHGERYMDTNLVELQTIQQFEKTIGSINIISKSDKKYMIDNHYNRLIGGVSSIRSFGFGYFGIKKSKQLFLYDTLGNELGIISENIMHFISPDFYLFEKGSKIGLADISNNIVIQPFEKSIEIIGDYFLCKGIQGERLLNRQFNELLKNKEGQILVDSKSGNVLKITNGKSVVYNSTMKKISKSKHAQAGFIYNNIIIENKAAARLLNLDFSLKDSLGVFLDLNYFPNGYIAIKILDKGWLLFDQKWNSIQPNEKILSIDYFGGDIFSFQLKSKTYILINFQNNQQIDDLDGIQGTISEGSLLIQKDKLNYFVNEDLQKIHSFNFLKATSYNNGFATVKDSRGWTLLNKNGIAVTYPSFSEIKVLGNNLFSTPKQAVYQIYTKEGKVILDKFYEKITFVNQKIIQLVSMGEISYFKVNGVKLF